MTFLNRIFGRGEASGQVARERLRKVLVQDRANVSPQVLERMRADMNRVLSQFMEIDEKNSQITINSSDRSVNLVANIPIRRMKRGKK